MSNSFATPKITVSSCLGFEATRYNGAMLDNAFVRKLREDKIVDFTTVCPEVAIGLGVPRETLRLVIKNGEKHLIQPKTKRDVTNEMLDFTNDFTENLVTDGFIFKADSPSVGTNRVKVYPGENAFVGKRGGAGFFTTQIILKFKNYPVESDRRLGSPYIQDSFLTKIYTIARFRTEILENKNSNLSKFHQSNYYLLMSHNPTKTKELDKFVKTTSKTKKPLQNYFSKILVILKDGAKREDLIFTFNSMIKEMSSDLTSNEVKFHLSKLEEFKINTMPKQAMLALLESLAIATKNEKLLNQSIFNPYPKELVNWEDPLQKRFLVNAYDLD